MSRFNHRTKWTQRDYIIRCTAITLVIGILVLFMPRESVRTYHYHEGGIWDYATLIAKDSFPILKSQEQLLAERDSVIHFYEPYFQASANTADSAIKAWNDCFQTELNAVVPSYYKEYITSKLLKIYDHGIISGTEQEIIRLFQMLAEKYGKTIIVVTHSDEVSKLSDRRILLKNGTLHDLN